MPLYRILRSFPVTGSRTIGSYLKTAERATLTLRNNKKKEIKLMLTFTLSRRQFDRIDEI